MPVYRSYFKAMACDNEVVTVAATPAQAQRQMAAAVEEVLRIEGKFSRYRDDSVVSHINREAGSGTPVACDEETGALLDFAAALFKESGGLFDITAGVLRQAWDFRTPRVPDESTLADLPICSASTTRRGCHSLAWRSTSAALAKSTRPTARRRRCANAAPSAAM